MFFCRRSYHYELYNKFNFFLSFSVNIVFLCSNSIEKEFQHCQLCWEDSLALLAVLIRSGMGLCGHFDGTGFSTSMYVRVLPVAAVQG